MKLELAEQYLLKYIAKVQVEVNGEKDSDGESLDDLEED
ncbi:unnamed protein product [Rhodiola kirilowii]